MTLSTMIQQLFLAGLDAEALPTDRLFLGIFPDALAAAQIRQAGTRLRDLHGLRGSLLATDRFHVTLHHIGDYAGLPTDIANRVQEAAQTVKTPTFDLSFDRAGSFSGRPHKLPFVLRGGDGLHALVCFQRQLFEALKRANVVRRTEPNFTPHVTLLYDDHNVAEQSIEPIRWTAREFVLIHSLLGQTRHIPLARWSLGT